MEIESLRGDQIAAVLKALDGHALHGIAVAGTKHRRKEGRAVALTWRHVDLDAATLRIERSLEQTRAGLKFKTPKTRNSRRTISLPPTAVEALRKHRHQQLEMRVALGQGKPDGSTLIFSGIDGDVIPPNNLSRDWRRFVRRASCHPVHFMDCATPT